MFELTAGAPYCLRRDTTALRNMRDYHGVSAARLEVLEERLKSDVEAELNAFGGTLLLHSEAADGKVVPLWENVNPEDVDSIRQVMDDVALREMDVNLVFERIPITSESSPDVSMNTPGCS
jgi:nitrate reductase NapAB chaperone NapD